MTLRGAPFPPPGLGFPACQMRAAPQTWSGGRFEMTGGSDDRGGAGGRTDGHRVRSLRRPPPARRHGRWPGLRACGARGARVEPGRGPGGGRLRPAREGQGRPTHMARAAGAGLGGGSDGGGGGGSSRWLRLALAAGDGKMAAARHPHPGTAGGGGAPRRLARSGPRGRGAGGGGRGRGAAGLAQPCVPAPPSDGPPRARTGAAPPPPQLEVSPCAWRPAFRPGPGPGVGEEEGQVQAPAMRVAGTLCCRGGCPPGPWMECDSYPC